MIRLGAAFICEAVSVHDSLLNVLGGGISQIGSGSFPSPFGSHLALMFYLDGTEGLNSYRLEVDCLRLSVGDVIFSFEGDLTVANPYFDVPQSLSAPINFSFMGIPEPGRYDFIIKVDSEEVARVPFSAFVLGAPSEDEPAA